MKRFICAVTALAALISAVSCGRTVRRSGENNGSEKNTGSRFYAVEVTQPPTEAETEPPTEEPTEPPTVNVKMPASYELAESCVISGFETVMQNPELPTGCEITALAQTLNFYGFGIDKSELCEKFMPVDFDGYYTMDQVYLGDPKSHNGCGCNSPVITKSANDYFDYIGSDWYAEDISGIPLTEVFYQIEQGRPVVVWSTIEQRESHAVFQFTLGCGEDFYFNHYQHCLTIYGFDYSKGTVHVADPLVGNVEYEMARFERIYDEMGNQAVVLCGDPDTRGLDNTTNKEKESWLKKNKPTDLEFLFGKKGAGKDEAEEKENKDD